MHRPSHLVPRAEALLASLLCLACPVGAAELVEGRYVYYGNPLSPYLALAEFEVYSGGTNVVAGHAEMFTQDYLYRPYRFGVWLLVDGKRDPGKRHMELGAPGTGTYSDTTLSYTAFEVDLGKTLPIERIDIYRSRYKMKGFKDDGWRVLLVLDEERRIVAWETYNVYKPPHPANKGLWSFVPKPAEGAPAGRVVPHRSRSWLSEAEYLRDFLGKPVIDPNQDLSEEDRARLERFQRRNDPAEITKLGEAFFRIVELERPGLKQVKALVAKEKYAEALEAFKAPFFETLRFYDGKIPFEYAWSSDPDSRSVMRTRDLMNGFYADKKNLTITRFTPGLLPPAKFVNPFQLKPLLQAYVATKNSEMLRLWEALTDDWALSFQDAADKDPRKLRGHFVLIGGAIQANMTDLLKASQDSPDFIKDVSGATLARYLTPIVEELPVSIWRVTRKCVFNHTFNALRGGWMAAQALADFHAGQRLDREMRQHLLRLHTLSQHRDGPMAEVCDEGHFLFNYLSPCELYGMLAVTRPDWFTPAVEAHFLDNLRQAELVGVRHTSPGGVGIRWAWKPTLWYPGFYDYPYDNPDPSRRGDANADSYLCAYLQRLSVMQEPESRAIVNAVYGQGRHFTKDHRPTGIEHKLAARYTRAPQVVSDWLPYSGCWYLRGGWDFADPCLHMLKTPIANSGFGSYHRYVKGYEDLNPTSYRFQDYATSLLTVFATEIDGHGPCEHYGRYPSGSKQYVFTQAVEKPQPMRWFTDERLDFGEAIYRGIYHTIYRYGRRNKAGHHEVYFEHAPVLVRGVTTSRQIVQVRPARLFLQIERVAYASAEETHTNRMPLTFLLREPAPETTREFSSKQLQVNADARSISMQNPGHPGATIAWFGQTDMAFKPYSVNESSSKFWPQPDPEEVNPAKDAKLFRDPWGGGYQTP